MGQRIRQLRRYRRPAPHFLAFQNEQQHRDEAEREREIAHIKQRRPLDLDEVDQARNATQQFRVSAIADTAQHEAIERDQSDAREPQQRCRGRRGVQRTRRRRGQARTTLKPGAGTPRARTVSGDEQRDAGRHQHQHRDRRLPRKIDRTDRDGDQNRAPNAGEKDRRRRQNANCLDEMLHAARF